MNRNKRTYFYLAVHLLSLSLLVAVALFILNNIKYFDEITGNYGTKLSVLSSTFPEVIKTVIIAPISEEVIFREWIYNFLKKRTKFYNIIQAFLFALYHFILVQSIYAFISGIFLGNVKRKTDSLETVIFCHSFFNLIGLQYLGYIYYYPIELIVKRFLHTENFIVMAIALLILPIIGFIWSWKKLGRDLYKL
jgi:CAAX amino terminal protease family protein